MRLLLCLTLLLAGCGTPVEPRPMCRRLVAVSLNPISGDTLGYAYGPVPCDNATYRDTLPH